MRKQCDDHWHHLSPTAALLIIEAFQEGDLTSTKNHSPRCLKYAFTTERVEKFQKLHRGNNITFDGVTYSVPKAQQLGRVQSRQHRP